MRAGAIAAIVAVMTALTPAAGANNKPWLGVSIRANCPVTASGVKRAGCRDGVFIAQIIDDTPASRSDLRPGDVIVKISGVAVTQPGALIDEITKKHKVGDVAVLEVVRGAQTVEIRVTLDARLSMSELFAKANVGTAARDVWRPLTPVKNKRISSRVSSHRGDVVVVYLFATSCRACAAITRTLESLQSSLGRRGLVVMAASEESPATLANLKTRLPLFSDLGNMVRRTFASGDSAGAAVRGALPLVAVVGRDGVITHAALGDGVDAVELRRAVERAVRVTTARVR